MDKKNTDNAITRQSLYGTTPEPTYAGVLSFSRRKYTRDLDGVDLVISGVPLDTATTNRPGARFGPRAIRAASTIMAWEKPYGFKFDPFDKLAVIDYGDCFLEFGRPQNVPAQIEEHAWKIIDRGPGLLSLGGDHFVAYPLLKAHARKHGAPLSLLHFDAHSDTWEDEEGRIDHGTMFFHAVKEGLIDPATSVQIGLRTQNGDTLGFNVLDGPWVQENGIGAVIRQTRKVLGDRPVYLSFDIDCLDPSFAPGTGTPVCGGLSSYQAISILRGLAGINLVGMDVVEVAPAYDVGEITALAAAHLAMEMIGLYASRPDK
ncbi:MAG: agmatinase [Gammaproteobacteria bacterium]|nr:agmatinase [Gammaproteobacteria bacterium]MDH4313871.1 agmatinase [Gammaproteobacteria bacterium]MDH5214888.1 agmatinase [Gammaproteobacteria bacterium]